MLSIVNDKETNFLEWGTYLKITSESLRALRLYLSKTSALKDIKESKINSEKWWLLNIYWKFRHRLKRRFLSNSPPQAQWKKRKLSIILKNVLKNLGKAVKYLLRGFPGDQITKEVFLESIFKIQNQI